MKKIKYLLILLLTLFVCTQTVSAEVLKKADENVSLSKNVFGSTALVGNNVSIDKDVDGIVFSASNIFKFNGNAEYIISAGNIIELNGTVEKDVIIAGNDITFNKDSLINRDIIVTGNIVNIKGKINGNIEIYASKVNIDNSSILGNVTIISDTINITGKTVVNNTLKYNEDAKISIKDESNINKILKTEKIDVDKPDFIDVLTSRLISLVRGLVVLFIMILVIPKLFKKVKKITRVINIKSLLLRIGKGLLSIIIVPIGILILLLSSFGTPLGIIFGLIYGILIYISSIITGFFIGNIIFDKFIKKDTNEFIIGACGLFIIYLLKLVPYLGILTSSISLLFGFGLFTELFLSGLKKNK